LAWSIGSLPEIPNLRELSYALNFSLNNAAAPIIAALSVQRFKGGKVEEVWKLGCDVVLDLLLPKIKKQFDEGTSHKKDPRIGVSIGQKEIESYGQRIR